MMIRCTDAGPRLAMSWLIAPLGLCLWSWFATPAGGQVRSEGVQSRNAFSRIPFARLDRNGDGDVTMDEFARLGETIPRLKAENVAGFLFARLDTNNDGSIDASEFRSLSGRSSLLAGPSAGRRGDAPHDPVVGPVARNPLRGIAAGPTDTESSAAVTAEEADFFHQRIEPVLAANCYSCHSSVAQDVRGGLKMDQRDDLRRGGSSGEVLDENPGDSLLVMALRGDGMPLMPPRGALPETTIRDFETWLSMGSPDPRPAQPRSWDSDSAPVQAVPESTIDIQAGRQHWAYQTIGTLRPSVIPGDDWSVTEIDRYLMAAWRTHSLTPAADADRETLIRRITLDLTGLPPTPAEVDAFIRDGDDDATALDRVADRLLASERFGEHWGRHWLDVARFAESSGKEVNLFYPFAWRYRDYVIDAMNEDKPIDEFLREQIAGDLLPATDATDRAEKLIATGYLAIGPKSHIERDPRQFLLDVVDEQIDAISRGMMGMTISCARCHDHKFDPISQRDYYALAGILASTETLFGGTRTVQTNRTTGLVELSDEADIRDGDSMSPAERQALNGLLETLQSARSPGTNNVGAVILTATTKSKLSHYDDDGSPRRLAMCVRDGQAMDMPMFLRGELERPADVVPRGFPAVITGPAISKVDAGSGRRELADWITDPQHPLTARVMANRVWQHLFGRGLVATPDNFGTTGTPPSHPELLDYLARSLRDEGWSMKTFIRTVVRSRAYRMASDADDAATGVDPDNVYVSRQNRKRLTAESIRDSILIVSGQLNLQPPVGSPVTRLGEGQTRVLDRTVMRMGGGMNGGQSNGVMNRGRMNGGGRSGGYVATPSLAPRPGSRSVYIPVIRDRVDPILDAFDFPDASLVTGLRETTNVAAQSLFFLNDDFVIDSADRMAKELMSVPGDDRDRIQAAFLATLSRRPRASEIVACDAHMKSLSREQRNPRVVWSQLCQSLMATAEFRFSP